MEAYNKLPSPLEAGLYVKVLAKAAEIAEMTLPVLQEELKDRKFPNFIGKPLD